mmetsp:Transcript_25846/g.72603  ORF Transcript_25846/g.72603 Transcript_25846/m.72603 type:complete len:269 (-) Transcript_25846:125-931(-)
MWRFDDPLRLVEEGAEQRGVMLQRHRVSPRTLRTRLLRPCVGEDLQRVLEGVQRLVGRRLGVYAEEPLGAILAVCRAATRAPRPQRVFVRAVGVALGGDAGDGEPELGEGSHARTEVLQPRRGGRVLLRALPRRRAPKGLDPSAKRRASGARVLLNAALRLLCRALVHVVVQARRAEVQRRRQALPGKGHGLAVRCPRRLKQGLLVSEVGRWGAVVRVVGHEDAALGEVGVGATEQLLCPWALLWRLLGNGIQGGLHLQGAALHAEAA